MIKEKQKGSITIFSLLSMLLVTACLLSLLEAGRYHNIKHLAQLQTDLALEAVFANYNSYLWETYRLLGTSNETMEELLIESANERAIENQKGTNLFRFSTKETEISGYTLLTDGAGAAYIDAVSNYMKKNLLYETAKEIYERYEKTKDILDNNEADMSDIDKALESLEEAKKKESDQGQKSKETGKQKEDNPLSDVKALSNKGILSVVLEKGTKIAEETYDFKDSVSNRKLQVGKNSVYSKVDWMDRVLVQQYLLTYLSSFVNQKDDRCLTYELEYLIGKKDSDEENLKTVVSKLLLLREAANLVYLASDIKKVEEITILATALTGAAASPLLIGIVKAGLLMAWAYAESVLDIRALLQGKRIPLLKDNSSWTSGLSSIGKLSEGFVVAKESEIGMSYEDYLGTLLLLKTDEQIAEAAMDVQEASVRKVCGIESFRMDDLMINAKVKVRYVYHDIFQLLQGLNVEQGWNYEVETEAEYGYT